MYFLFELCLYLQNNHMNSPNTLRVVIEAIVVYTLELLDSSTIFRVGRGFCEGTTLWHHYRAYVGSMYFGLPGNGARSS